MFWKRTPRQIAATIEARNKKWVTDHNEQVWLAWHIASWQRSKKMPPLKKVLVKVRQKRPRQTQQEQMEIMQQWTKAMQRVQDQRKRPA